MTTTARVLRGVGLLAALVAAVVVFVLGGRDGGTDWQVPALVLIGVLVLILQAATGNGSRRPVIAADAPSPRVLHALPHHLAEPSRAEFGPGQAVGVPSAAHLHGSMPEVVVPAASFPDAGHGHGPVIAVSDELPPPPLHAVLGASSGPPPPVVGSTPAAAPDPLLVDLRPDTPDPMVMRVLPGEPPPPGSRDDVVAPALDSTDPRPPHLPPPFPG